MALPQVGGSFSAHYSGVATVVLDISSVPVGGWMVVSVMAGAAVNVSTPPAGWTVIADNVVTNTRTNSVYAKIKTSGDGSTATFTHNSSSHQLGYGLLWGTGATAVDTWSIGVQWLREHDSVEASGSRYTNIAKSVTTASDDSLVLAISQEATLALVAQNEITSITPSGWTERVSLQQPAANDRIETVWMGTKLMPTVGASGDVSIAYSSPQDKNGWTIQIAISSTAPADVYAPVVVGTSTTAYAVGGSLALPRPSGLLKNDYIVIVVRGQSSSATADVVISGFTRLGPAFAASSLSRLNGFYGHPVTNVADEPQNYSLSSTGSGGTRFTATAFIVRGVDLTDPVAGYFDSYAGTSITNGRSVDSFSLPSTPSLQLFMGGSEFASPNNHVPSAYPTGLTKITELSTSTDTGVSRTYLWVGSKEVSTLTSYLSITWSGTASGAAAESIALRASNLPPVGPEGEAYATYTGTGGSTQRNYVTADGPPTPSEVLPMRRGFATALEAINTPGVTWAHRGGSVSYPEMSLHGYTQSVARGYGVLEVSLARTSDGVWFGLHDKTTDRTSGGTYGNASSQTWAQVQAQQIVIGPGAAQPYMRWSEIVAAYGATHILVVDPKYALGSYRTEFLDMVDRDLGPTKAIIKFSGGGSGATALSTAAIARGYQTWGFFYATDASAAQGGSGSLQTWGPYWTMIGMDYTASQAVWDEALALGKPVIGHIAPSQSAYNTAMSKGASGVQVSGVGVVTPVSWWT